MEKRKITLFLVEKNKLSLLGLINNYNKVYKVSLCAKVSSLLDAAPPPMTVRMRPERWACWASLVPSGEFPANTDIKTELKVATLTDFCCLSRGGYQNKGIISVHWEGVWVGSLELCRNSSFPPEWPGFKRRAMVVYPRHSPKSYTSLLVLCKSRVDIFAAQY